MNEEQKQVNRSKTGEENGQLSASNIASNDNLMVHKQNCPNCGSEKTNDSQFCGICGFKQPITTENKQNNKNSKKKIIIISLVLFGILIIALLVNKVSNSGNGKFEDPFQDIEELVDLTDVDDNKEYKEIITVDSVLEEDYLNNEISADEYILQLAYSIYDYDLLDDKYKSYDMGFDNYDVLADKLEELDGLLSDDTYLYIFQKVMLADVEIDVNLTEEDINEVIAEFKKVLNISESDIIGQEINNEKEEMMLMNNSYGNLRKLNKAKLSKNGNFIIYYLDSEISEDTVTEIANTLESTVEFYEKEFGLKYNLDLDVISFLQLEPKLQLKNVAIELMKTLNIPNYVLKKEDINLIRIGKLLIYNKIDLSNLFTAMPVFVLDFGGAALGKYNSSGGSFDNTLSKVIVPIINDLCKGGLQESNFCIDNIFHGGQIDQEQIDLAFNSIVTAYTFPNILIDSNISDFDNLKLALGHELFHHYQRYICGDGDYVDCLDDSFTTEITANLASYYYNSKKISKYNTIFNGHAAAGAQDSSEPLDQAIEFPGNKGYNAYLFGYNYASVVENGINVLFESMKYENSLKYLYDNSNGNYKKALLLTAEKYMTLDYDNKLLVPIADGFSPFPGNYSNLGTTNNRQTFNIHNSSMHYFYIKPNNYGENSQIIFEKKNDDLTLLLFVREDNKYRYLYTHSLTEDFVVNVSDFKYYDEVVFSVVNSSILAGMSYSVEVMENGDRTPTVTKESLNLKSNEDVPNNFTSIMCNKVEKDELYQTVYQIKLSFDKKDKINDMYAKATVKMLNTDPDDPIFMMAQQMTSGIFEL